MTILGILLVIVGGGGALLLLTGAVSSLTPILSKMPMGMTGFAIVAVIGVVLMILNRRPSD